VEQPENVTDLYGRCNGFVAFAGQGGNGHEGDHTSGPGHGVLGGIFRGYTEFYFSGNYFGVVHGPENWIAGIMAGPRYNFVQPGWKIVPFISAGVGIDFTDSKPQYGGFGQDFNFSFETSAGFKYLINDEWFMRLAVEYKHISNAGMSEPTNPNNPIDALGPQLSVGCAF
jgi:opacity protein-like surface antigen